MHVVLVLPFTRSFGQYSGATPGLGFGFPIWRVNCYTQITSDECRIPKYLSLLVLRIADGDRTSFMPCFNPVPIPSSEKISLWLKRVEIWSIVLLNSIHIIGIPSGEKSFLKRSDVFFIAGLGVIIDEQQSEN